MGCNFAPAWERTGPRNEYAAGPMDATERDLLARMLEELPNDDKVRLREACQRDALFLCRMIETLAAAAAATKPEGQKMVAEPALEAHGVAASYIKASLPTLMHHVEVWSMVRDPDKERLYEVLELNSWLVGDT